jgi:hypothetical protein
MLIKSFEITIINLFLMEFKMLNEFFYWIEKPETFIAFLLPLTFSIYTLIREFFTHEKTSFRWYGFLVVSILITCLIQIESFDFIKNAQGLHPTKIAIHVIPVFTYVLLSFLKEGDAKYFITNRMIFTLTFLSVCIPDLLTTISSQYVGFIYIHITDVNSHQVIHYFYWRHFNSHWVHLAPFILYGIGDRGLSDTLLILIGFI